MAIIMPRSQASLFYSRNWTKQVDSRFISRLVRETILAGTEKLENKMDGVRKARTEINEAFGTQFSLDVCLRRFRKLEERYTVFSFILNVSGVHYDEMNNSVHVTDQGIWDYICEHNRLGEAYLVEGEPHWKDLCTLFGEPVPITIAPPAIEIIEISSDTSVSVEIPPDIILAQRSMFAPPPHRAPYHSNAFTDDLAIHNEQFGSRSAIELESPVTRPPEQSRLQQLMPRRLWPTSSDEISDEASSSVQRRASSSIQRQYRR